MLYIFNSTENSAKFKSSETNDSQRIQLTVLSWTQNVEYKYIKVLWRFMSLRRHTCSLHVYKKAVQLFFYKCNALTWNHWHFYFTENYKMSECFICSCPNFMYSFDWYIYRYVFVADIFFCTLNIFKLKYCNILYAGFIKNSLFIIRPQLYEEAIIIGICDFHCFSISIKIARSDSSVAPYDFINKENSEHTIWQ